MKRIVRYRRSTIFIFLIVSCIFLLTKCISNDGDKAATESTKEIAANPDYFQLYAGSEKCASCHKNIYKDNVHTAHYLTTRPAIEKYIKGSFDSGNNAFVYDPDVTVKMEKRDSGLFQVLYYKGIERKTLRFDIVIGSGAKGQSFMSWNNNRLTQLPITYFTAPNQWANSPGFPSKVLINRPITSRCLECHSTYVYKTSAPDSDPEEFDHKQIIYGVDCEKCHGPGAKHVEFQTQNPKDTTGKFIINPARLSRIQNLELCALCHGGRMQKTKPSFTFTAGDKLSDYFMNDSVSSNAVSDGYVDVHGNQYGMLKASKCFRMSATLTCTSCHNPHENERGKIALFSQRCISCHKDVHDHFTKINNTPVLAINKNCIDCHMPAQPSRAITLLLPGSQMPTAALIRTHFIAIYPLETKNFIDRKNKQ
jgi:nitrate/TMAO reductase-like tetraheme cytochrome c subunit